MADISISGIYEYEDQKVAVRIIQDLVIAITEDGRSIPPMDVVTNGRKIQDLPLPQKKHER